MSGARVRMGSGVDAGRRPTRWSAVAYRVNDTDRCFHCNAELMDVVGPDSQRRRRRRSCSGSTSTISATDGPGEEGRRDRWRGVPSGRGRIPRVRRPRRLALHGVADVGQAGRGMPRQPDPVRHPRSRSTSSVGSISGRGRVDRPLGFCGGQGPPLRRHGVYRARCVTCWPRPSNSRVAIIDAVTAAGYRYVTLDLEGFRSGNAVR